MMCDNAKAIWDIAYERGEDFGMHIGIAVGVVIGLVGMYFIMRAKSAARIIRNTKPD